MGMRHESRVMALQLLFQMDTCQRFHQSQLLISLFFNHLIEEPPPELRKFAISLCKGVCSRLGEIDSYLNQNVHHWRLDRMDRVDRNILRLAVYELLNDSDAVPVPVIINEAIELAKEFGSSESGGFVHGAITQVLKAISRPQEEIQLSVNHG